jgi:predicted nucleotidyltransferase
MTCRPIIEGFAVETIDGAILTVKGLLHPPERVIAYLRYVPDPAGDRQRADRRYRRVYHFSEQREIIAARYPDLIDYDPVLGVEVQSVARSHIDTVYDPVHFLRALRQNGPTGPVTDDALALAVLIQEAAGVPWSSLGISGSVLVGMQRPESDVDLIVYGEESARAVYWALEDLMAVPAGAIGRPDDDELAILHQAHRPETPLSFADFARAQRRKVNEGCFRGRSVFVRFIKEQHEYGERYGDRRYRPLGPVTGQGIISDDRDAIFTPCRYELQEARILAGAQVADLDAVVSYRGRFSDQARVGEQVEVRGTLEAVEAGKAPCRYQVVVGGRAGDYLRVVPG